MIHLLDPLPTLVDTVSNVHVFPIFSDHTTLSDDDVRGLGDEVCSCNVDRVRLFLITHQAITQAEHTTIAIATIETIMMTLDGPLKLNCAR